MAIAFAIGVVVDVRIDFAGAGRMLFGGLALALCPFRLFLCGELGLLRAPGSGVGLLAQSCGLLAPLLQPALASDDKTRASKTTAATTITMIQVVLMDACLPRPSGVKPSYA